jgi:outer membrane translocation and assembly module TamA
VILPGPVQRFEDTPSDRLVVVSVEPGKPLVYRAGAGWSKSGEFRDAAAWERYVQREARKSTRSSAK